MSFIDLFTRYLYNPSSRRWLDTATGRFVAERDIASEIARLQRASIETMQTLTRQLYAGGISLPEWKIAIAAELKDAHIAQATLARGGRDFMGPQELGRVGGNLGDEYGHLQRFAQGISDGKVSEARALDRIKQYGNATDQAYTREWAIQRRRPEWDGLPVLNQVPRDGHTRCHGNCDCYLEEHEDGIYWIGGDCPDCDSVSGGPYQPGSV